MNSEVVAIFARAWRLGLELRAAGDKLRYRPRDRMTNDLAGRIKVHRDDVLEVLHDRSAIMQFEGGLDRPTADRLAWADVRGAAVDRGPASIDLAPDPAGLKPARMTWASYLAGFAPPASDARPTTGVPRSWSALGWIRYLRQSADAWELLHPERAAELRAQAGLVQTN